MVKWLRNRIAIKRGWMWPTWIAVCRCRRQHRRSEWFRVHRMVWSMGHYTTLANRIWAILVILDHFTIIMDNIITYRATAARTTSIRVCIMLDLRTQVPTIHTKRFTQQIHIITKSYARMAISILFQDNFKAKLLEFFQIFWYLFFFVIFNLYNAMQFNRLREKKNIVEVNEWSQIKIIEICI